MIANERPTHRWIEQLREERESITSLAERAALDADRCCDIHLCYGEGPDERFKGFLVTWRGNPDRLVAYRPVDTRVMGDPIRRASELRRSFAAVVGIASRPEMARRSPAVLWLGAAGDVDRPVPGWVYGLRCVPLAGEWDGEFLRPRPFCPQLFERMARQPQALRWLERHQQTSPTVSAGHPEGEPAAPEANA